MSEIWKSAAAVALFILDAVIGLLLLPLEFLHRLGGRSRSLRSRRRRQKKTRAGVELVQKDWLWAGKLLQATQLGWRVDVALSPMGQAAFPVSVHARRGNEDFRVSGEDLTQAAAEALLLLDIDELAMADLAEKKSRESSTIEVSPNFRAAPSSTGGAQ